MLVNFYGIYIFFYWFLFDWDKIEVVRVFVFLLYLVFCNVLDVLFFILELVCLEVEVCDKVELVNVFVIVEVFGFFRIWEVSEVILFEVCLIFLGIIKFLKIGDNYFMFIRMDVKLSVWCLDEYLF